MKLYWPEYLAEGALLVTTRPGPAAHGGGVRGGGAHLLVLMATALRVSASRRAAWTGACAGALVALFITVAAHPPRLSATLRTSGGVS